MNIRNEIKAQIIRAGMTMQEVVDLLSDEYGWSDSVSNLSAKLQRESIRYPIGAPQCCPWTGSERYGFRCHRLQEMFRRTASCRRADQGKRRRHFALVSRGHRSDRIPPRESPRRAHGTL